MDPFWAASQPGQHLVATRRPETSRKPALGACLFSRRAVARGSLSQGLRGAKHLAVNGRFYPFRGHPALGVLASCEKLASVGIPSYISRKCLSASPEASG